MVAPTTVQGQPEPGHANALDSVTTDRLQSFFERDNNSRLTSGKKQTVTKNKLKKQKCLLLDTAVNLHQKFCAEYIYITNCVPYAPFARLCTFGCASPHQKTEIHACVKDIQMFNSCQTSLHREILKSFQPVHLQLQFMLNLLQRLCWWA